MAIRRKLPRLVGLCGPEGAGKSTVAKLLCREHGFAVVPFAKPLKAMLEALGVPPAHLYGTPDQKAQPLDILCGRSARDAMQKLGTEWGRQLIGEDLWSGAWHAAINAAWDAGAKGVVADDLRFQNEAEAVRLRSGEVWCIVRRLKDFDRVPKHASENFAAIPRNGVIYNNGTVDQLSYKLAQRFPIKPRYFGPVAAE